MSDEQAIERLARAVDFIAVELTALSLDIAALHQARWSYRTSTLHFVYSSLHGLDEVDAFGDRVPSSLRDFARALAAEIRSLRPSVHELARSVQGSG